MVFDRVFFFISLRAIPRGHVCEAAQAEVVYFLIPLKTGYTNHDKETNGTVHRREIPSHTWV